jgi:hypothetical protein
MIGEGTHSTNQRRHTYVRQQRSSGSWLSIDKHGAADRAIHEHGSGWLIRIGEAFTGPIPLVLRFFGAIPLAAISFLLGALVSRFGWIAVGKISGRDPESVFAAQKVVACYAKITRSICV